MELVCRTCLKMNKTHFNIFEHTENDKLISDMIMECASIKVEENDGFPINICTNCVDKLSSACDFKAMIVQSNAKLQNFYLNKTLDTEQDTQKTDNTIWIKEEVVLKTEQSDPPTDPICNVTPTLENAAQEGITIQFKEWTKQAARVKQCDSHNESSNPDYSVHTDNDSMIRSEKTMTRLKRKNKLEKTKVILEELSDHDDHVGDDLSVSNETSSDSETSSEIRNNSSASQQDAELKPAKEKDNTKKNYINAQLLDNPDYQRIINSGLSKKEKDRETVFCRECGKRLTFRYYVAVHAHTHTGNIPFKCEECGRAYPKESLLKNHMRVHLISKDFSCEICGIRFRTIYKLRIHRLKHTEERPHKCEVCGNAFKSIATLKQHELTHRNDRKYMCELCGRAFIKIAGLRNHMITHRTEKNFICPTCGKNFSCKRNLCDHLTRHTSEKPYVCNHCGKRFKNHMTLRNHISLHTAPKLFPCEICAKNFRQRASLSKHMRLHTGETPYPCEFCHSKFKYSHHLQNHVRVHHKDKYKGTVKGIDAHHGNSNEKVSI